MNHQKPSRSAKARLLCLSLAVSAVVSACLFIALDRVLGALRPGLALGNVLFPPMRVQTFATPEFTYTATINNLGFRDRPFDITKAGTRVLVIGDSFTYGWGIALEQTWVKLTEARLRSRGLPLEMANLGKPGIGPGQYADIAEKAIPLLKPDLVIVATLQTDDLQQSRLNPVLESTARTAGFPLWKDVARTTAVTLVPNIFTLARQRNVVTENWADQTARIIDSLDTQERARFDRLEPELRRAYVDGALNPFLLVLAVKTPGYFSDMADVTSSDTRRHIEAMSNHFSRIKAVADRFHAQVLVVSVPHRLYVSPEDLQTVRRLGFDVDDRMLHSNSADVSIARAAEAGHLDMIQVTRAFHDSCQTARCYFRLDDHFNVYGHETFAALIAERLDPIVSSRVARKAN